MVGMNYQGQEKKLPLLTKPPLPPSVKAGGHGGSHGYLGNEFVMSILENRKPLVDIGQAVPAQYVGGRHACFFAVCFRLAACCRGTPALPFRARRGA